MREMESRVRNDFIDIRKELNIQIKALDDRTADFPEEVTKIHLSMKSNSSTITKNFAKET